jgi:hypothetical protein
MISPTVSKGGESNKKLSLSVVRYVQDLDERWAGILRV